MGLLDRALDVARVVVAAGNDDHVFVSAGDEQLGAVQETQVSGTQEGAFARVGEAGAEDLGRDVRALPVPQRDARPGHPDLTDLVGGHPGAGRGIHDDHVLPGDRLPAADPGQLVVPGTGGQDRVRRQRPGLQATGHRLGGPVPAADHQRGLGQAVARIERRPPEPVGRERAREPVDGLRAHRFGPGERQLPRAQVEVRPFIRGDLRHAQVEGEVRAAADGRPELGDRP